METVLGFGNARPSLGAEMARRGLRLVPPEPPCGAARAGVRFAGAPAGATLSVPLLLVVEGGDPAVVAAIDAGADDAVPASASDALIAARLAALVRRSPDTAVLRLGDLVIDRVERRVQRGGRPLVLLPREYRLLLHLAEHAGAVVSHAALRQAVWGLHFDPGTNVVAVHVSRLRAKLDRGFAVPLLHTDKGIGYRLDPGLPGVAAAASSG